LSQEEGENFMTARHLGNSRLALAALTLVALVAASPAHAQQQCGDLDNNGSVSAADALRLLQKAVGQDRTLLCPGVSGGPFDASEILRGFAEETVFLTYRSLADEAEVLRQFVVRLSNTVNGDNLEAAQTQWRETRTPWEASEGFLFGPVGEAGLDPRLDSWPVNKTDLDNILASSADLTDPDVIALLDNTVKGFHTIEFLLFDDGTGTAGTAFIGNRDTPSIVAALTANARRVQYMIGVTTHLAETAEELADAWDPADGNFAAQVSQAGKSSTRWQSQRSALQEIIEAIAGIADEVANGKISDPYFEQNTRLVESQFSFNSLADFTNNMESVRNVYQGANTLGCFTAGLSAYVVTVDAALDARVRAEIQDTVDAIAAIEPPFRESITNPAEADDIQAAIDTINVLRATIEGDLFTTIVTEGKFAF
jgi:putative iron-regulated protein